MDELGMQMFRHTNAGYCCSQIMIKMVLDEEEKENEDLLRAVSSFCLGSGSYQKTCGVLSAGIAIFGLYAGKGKDSEYPKEGYSEMVDEFTDWFLSEFGSTECKDIIGACNISDYMTNQSYRLKCGDILMKSYQMVREILQEHDYEFGSRD